MTGPVFTRATESLAEIGKARRRPKIYFQVMSGHPESSAEASAKADRDATINTIATLLEVIRNRWNDRTYEIVEHRATKSVDETARALGVRQTTVYRHIWTFGVDEVERAEQDIRNELLGFA